MKAPLALIVALTITSCASSQPARWPTLYERMGSRPAITAIIDNAMVNDSADPCI